jgi:N-formylglutamate amidohydrolase
VEASWQTYAAWMAIGAVRAFTLYEAAFTMLAAAFERLVGSLNRDVRFHTNYHDKANGQLTPRPRHDCELG